MNRDELQEIYEKIVDIGFSNYDQLNDYQKLWFNIQPLIDLGVLDHYINSGAEHNEDTIFALDTLGFSELVQGMYTINSLFPQNVPPIDIEERNIIRNNFCDINEDLLNKISDQFDTESNSLEESLFAYVQKNIDQFKI